MLRAARQDQKFVLKIIHVQPLISFGYSHQADIHITGQDQLINPAGAEILNMDVHIRVADHEGLDVIRQGVHSDAENRGNVDPAHGGSFQGVEFTAELFVPLEDILGRLVE